MLAQNAVQSLLASQLAGDEFQLCKTTLMIFPKSHNPTTYS